MLIDNRSNSLRFLGRWTHCEDGRSITTAPGAYFEFCFKGNSAVMNFDINYSHHPYPHLYIIVDNGAKLEVPIDAMLRIETETNDEHYVQVIFKSSVEQQHRWYYPLEAKVELMNIEVDEEGTLAKDDRKIIEFIGDSITEGVLIDNCHRPIAGNDTYTGSYQDDSTATYAYLTAKAMNYRPLIMGYGAVGLTKGGSGSVPKVREAYPFNFDNSPCELSKAGITVINHGANDRGNRDTYIDEYYAFLELVRKRNPNTKIVVLGPFCGFAAKELKEMVERFNELEKDNVIYINTEGWIPLEPLHPDREGHKVISRHLISALKEIV